MPIEPCAVPGVPVIHPKGQNEKSLSSDRMAFAMNFGLNAFTGEAPFGSLGFQNSLATFRIRDKIAPIRWHRFEESFSNHRHER